MEGLSALHALYVSGEMKRLSTFMSACLMLGCVNVPGEGNSPAGSMTARAAEVSASARPSPPEAEFLTLADRIFTSPADGAKFQIILGPRLWDLNEVTAIPDGIIGERKATASFYTVTSKDGRVLGKAESSISEDHADRLDMINIQFERESGRILVTEDTSDALPCKRYILFSPTDPTYDIEFLELQYEPNHFGVQGSSPELPQVILLSGDRVWVDGEILPLSKIPKSRLPFSSGG